MSGGMAPWIARSSTAMPLIMWNEPFQSFVDDVTTAFYELYGGGLHTINANSLPL